MKLHSTLLMLAAALTSLVVAATCAAPVEVTFWHALDGAPGKAFSDIVGVFNDTHPSIKVKIETKDNGGYFFESYQVALLANAGPDVMWMERSIVANWARAGLLKPLGAVGQPQLIGNNRFLPAPHTEVVWEGKIWAVPWNTDIRGLYWNSDMLDSAGMDSTKGPQTWEQLNSWATKLTHRDGAGSLTQVGLTPWAGNWFMPAWVWAFGGELVDATTQTASFDSVRAVEALEWVSSFAEYATPAEAARLPMESGKKAFETEGNWAVRVYADSIRLGMGRVPHPEGGRNGTWGGGFAIALPAAGKHPAEAREFIEWMATWEPQLMFAATLDHLPTNLQALGRYIATQPRSMFDFLQQADQGNTRYKFVWQEVFTASDEARARVVNERVPPRNAMEQAQKSVQARIDAIFVGR